MVLMLSPGAVFAQGFVLRYVAPQHLAQCPTESALAAAVSRRLGRSPWSAASGRVVEVKIAHAAGGLEGEVRLRGKGGAVHGVRRLRAALDECRELGKAIALAVSIAIDPRSALAVRHETPPVRTRRSLRPPVALSRGAPIDVSLRSAFHVAVGVGPAASAGATLQLAVSWRWLRAALEARFDSQAASILDEPHAAGVDAALVGATALGCAAWRWLYGCATITTAALLGGGVNLAAAERVASVYFAPGLRLGVQFTLVRALFGYSFGQLDIPLVRARYVDTSGGRQLWSAPPVAAAFGVGLGVRLW